MTLTTEEYKRDTYLFLLFQGYAASSEPFLQLFTECSCMSMKVISFLSTT